MHIAHLTAVLSSPEYNANDTAMYCDRSKVACSLYGLFVPTTFGTVSIRECLIAVVNLILGCLGLCHKYKTLETWGQMATIARWRDCTSDRGYERRPCAFS